MHRQRLPLAFSCPQSLGTMPRRADAERWCGACEKSVFDLSAMSESEARRLLNANADAQMCVHYRFDRDGRVVFRDRLSRRSLLALAGWSLMVTMSSAGCLVGKASVELEAEHARRERIDWSGIIGVIVLDNRTGQPIADASVYVQAWRTERWSSTDEQGVREFEDLDSGDYRVHIIAGLAQATEWVQLDPRTRVEVTFRMDPSVASFYPQRQWDEPVELEDTGLIASPREDDEEPPEPHGRSKRRRR